MRRAITISLGKVQEDQIRFGIDAAATALAAELARVFGGGTRIKREWVAVQHEVTPNGKSVQLKVVHQRLRLRDGFFEGADVDIYWHRARAEEIRIQMRSMSTFLERCFVGALAVAGAISLYESMQKQVLSDVRALYLYALAFAALMVPYFCLRTVMSIKGREYLDRVRDVVKTIVMPAGSA